MPTKITNGISFEHDKIMDEETYDRLSDDISSYLIPVEKVLPPDGKWCLWVSETGAVEIAEYITDAVAWMPLPIKRGRK